MKLSCIAVDDEKLALDFLADNISRVPFLNLAAKCRNSSEAGEAIKNHWVDLVILDIEMPGLNGLEFIKAQDPRPMVIFVTAYDHYAVDAFSVEAIDYLVKPVAFDRFLQAVNKAFLFFTHNRYLAGNADAEAEFLFINIKYSLVKVFINDIMYVQGLDDYIRLYLHSVPKGLVVRLTMKAILDMLPGRKFLRIHRSFIVAVSAVAVINKSSLLINGSGMELPIGAGFRKNVDAVFRKNKRQEGPGSR